MPGDSKLPPIKGPPWPADQIVKRKVKDLVPYANNARTHSKEQVEQIARAIQEWGWTVPCVIDEEGGLIAGHGRVLAASAVPLRHHPR